MKKEFTLSVFYKIFYVVAAFIGVGIGSLLIVGINNTAQPFAMTLLGLIFIAGGIFLALYNLKRRITISDTDITVSGLFGSTQLLLTDIKGFEKSGKDIVIKPLDNGTPRLVIRYVDTLGKKDEFTNWLKNNLTDIDGETYKLQKEKLLSDPSLGFTLEEREAKFKLAHRMVLVYSVVCFLPFLVAAILQQSDTILTVVLLVLPLIGVALMATSRGLIRLYAEKNDASATVFLGMFFSCIGLALQIMGEHKIDDLKTVWGPVITASFFLMILLIFVVFKQPNPNLKKQVIFVLLFGFVYGFGSVIQINFMLDGSRPKVYQVKVVERYVQEGKRTTYHVVLTKWGHKMQNDDITVNKDFYNHVAADATVAVNLKRGRLNIPWYYVKYGPSSPAMQQ